MSRRGDPDRIDLARRYAVRNRLMAVGMSEERAETWCDAWEVEAARRRIPRAAATFWRDGSAWIDEQRRRP
jgi:hypothetical protein